MPLDMPAQAPSSKQPIEKAPSDHLYWARSSSINAAPPPKAISVEEAKALESASAQAGGSAWNKGGSTWEEKKINQWAIDLLSQELLPSLTYEVVDKIPPSPEGYAITRAAVRVYSVGHVKGDTTYVMSRGKERCIFELDIKLKLEMELYDAEGSIKEVLTGKLTVGELTNDELSDSVLPSHKCVCEQAAWKGFFEKVAKGSWPGIKACLEALVEQAKSKWR